MARVRLRDGADYPDIPLLEVDDLTLDEVLGLEQFVGQPAEDWSATLQSKVMLWHSGVKALGLDAAPSWQYLGDLKRPEVERIPDPEDDDADPPAGAGPSPAPADDDPAAPGSTPTSSST